MDLSPQQLQQFKTLGLDTSISIQTSTKNNLLPLFSISGLTLISIGGLLFLKSKNNSSIILNNSSGSPTEQVNNVPTQVPKSIQHYLLASQQAFSQALSLQSSKTDSNNVISYLNTSITSATTAIKEFPNDYRGFEQRARIYTSLVDSQPQLLPAAISDYEQAQKLNPSSADLTRQLASLYAKKGDLQNTINYLSATVSLEPTKAQNFYDLAKIQQQAGLFPDALNTYNQLLLLISDSVQKNQLETEKNTLEKIIAQNNIKIPLSPTTIPQNTPMLDSNLLQASTFSSPQIAAPENSPNITLNNQTDSNSLSGTATLASGEKQITIQNSKLSNSSQIYLTIISGGKNQSLELLSKSNNSFTAGFQSSLSENVTFKWWIVN